jgi:hypothetical protein
LKPRTRQQAPFARDQFKPWRHDDRVQQSEHLDASRECVNVAMVGAMTRANLNPCEWYACKRIIA